MSSPAPAAPATQNSPFLRLPHEIRFMIYDRYFESLTIKSKIASVPWEQRTENGFRIFKPHQSMTVQRIPALLGVCRLVNQETSDRWFSRVTFIFSNLFSLVETLYSWSDEQLASVKNIAVHNLCWVDVQTSLRSFKIPENVPNAPGNRDSPPRTSDGRKTQLKYPIMLPHILECFPTLRLDRLWLLRDNNGPFIDFEGFNFIAMTAPYWRELVCFVHDVPVDVRNLYNDGIVEFADYARVASRTWHTYQDQRDWLPLFRLDEAGIAGKQTEVGRESMRVIVRDPDTEKLRDRRGNLLENRVFKWGLNVVRNWKLLTERERLLYAEGSTWVIRMMCDEPTDMMTIMVTPPS